MIDWLIFFGALIIIFGSAKLNPTSLMGRGGQLFAVVIGATLVVSLSLRLIPGDPVDNILGDQALEASRELLRKDLGLVNEHGEPLNFVEQYGYFLRSLIKMDVKSFITRTNAFEIIAGRLPYTILLGLCAMIIATMLGPIFGVVSAVFRNQWPDHFFSLFALVGISTPSFFLGPILLLLFAIKLKLLPISGADDGMLSLVLPSLSMGTALAAGLTRMSRACMLEVLSEDYIRTARAKGASASIVFIKHALRNALIPVVTLIGLQFGAVLAGAVVTEKVFNWPGIGLLLLESIQRLDMPVVQAVVLVIALLYAIINLLTDIVYSIIDPRVSLGAIEK